MAETIRAASRDERVINAIASFVGVGNDQLERDQPIKFVSPSFDSLDEVELVMELEDIFSIEIDDLEAENLSGQKVQAYIDYINNRKDIS